MLSIRHHGGVRVIISLANYLREKGHNIYLITPRDRFNPLYPIKSDVNIILTPPVAEFGYVSHILSLFWLYRYIPSSDFIVANFFPTFFPAYYASKGGKGKLLYFVQGFEESFYDGLLKYISRLTYRMDGTFIVISRWIAKNISRYAHTIKVIPPGPEEGIFFPEPEPSLLSGKKAPALLFIWRKERKKGIFEYLKALQILEDRRADFEAWFIVLEEETLPNISLKKPIKFFTPKSDSELRRLYSSADIFVSASWIEGFGLPPLEAMACGTPAVLTQSGGVSEFARDGVNSFIVPPKDPIKLSEAIMTLLKDENLRNKLKEGALSTSKKFSLRKMAEEFENYLLSIGKG